VLVSDRRYRFLAEISANFRSQTRVLQAGVTPFIIEDSRIWGQFPQGIMVRTHLEIPEMRHVHQILAM